MDTKKMIDLAAEGYSTRQISAQVGCSQTSVRRYLCKVGIKTDGGIHSKREIKSKKCPICNDVFSGGKLKNKYCSKECQIESLYRDYIKKWLNREVSGNQGDGHRNSSRVSDYVRKWLIRTRGEKCEKCGWDKVNPKTGKIPITVHHKNGDWRITTPENIEFLCPNEHSLTDTYGACNRGQGRKTHK
jgi:hypothetical protein